MTVVSWFVSAMGEAPEGPLPTEAVIQAIHEGRLGMTAQVCQVGQQAWMRIADVVPFAQALQEGRGAGTTRMPPLSESIPVRMETPAGPMVVPTGGAPGGASGAVPRAGTRGVARRRRMAIAGAALGVLGLVGGLVGVLGKSRTGTRDARVRQALVHVIAGESGGTGFFVQGPDANAYVVTAYHVIESGDPVRIERMVEVSDKKSYVEAYPSTEVVAVDPDADIAVIRLKEVQGSKFAKLALAKAVVKDTKIVAHGFPSSNLGKLESSVNQEGKISATTKFRVLDRVSRKEIRSNAIDGLIISAQIEPGYSGGPTLNEDDEVVGVNVLKDLEHTQQSGAVSVEVLAKLLSTLKPASDPVPPRPEEVGALLAKIQADQLKRPIADRMEVRETEFVSSQDIPLVRKLAHEVAEMAHDTTPDERQLTGRARLGIVFEGLPGKGLATYRSPEVTKALAACPKEALSLFGSFRGGARKDGQEAPRPTVDCERYASRALAWDLTASVLQWEDSERELTVSTVEPTNSESRSFKATVSAKGSSSSFTVWVSTDQGRLRLKLFDDAGKPYWIERHGSAEGTAFNGSWRHDETRQRVVLSKDEQHDAKTTETIDVSVSSDGDVKVKHRFLREWYADNDKKWTCNRLEGVEVGLEQNLSGWLHDGAIRLSPTTMNQDGSPRVERIGKDLVRCPFSPRYTPDRLVLIKLVGGRLHLFRTDGSEYPERIDFNR